jgi:sugar phosphate isomerase/epimerase
MNLLLVRHLWGVTEPLTTVIPKIKTLGFGAIETPVLWLKPNERATLKALLADHDLRLIPQVFTRGGP